MGDGGDGSGRAWVLEVILQLIVRAGKVTPRRAWILGGGPLEVLLRPILPLGRCGRSLLSRAKGGALRRKDKPVATIWAEASQSGSWSSIMALDHQRGDGDRHHTLAASPMEVEVLRRMGNSVSKCALGMMHVL